MLNPIKIAKSINHLMTNYGEGIDLQPKEKDEKGNLRIDYVVSLYRELAFPFGFIMTLKNRKTKLGRDVVWGRKHNDKDYVENVVIPKLMDFNYLKKLKPNTVGAHYYNLIKNFGIEDLYNQRFTEEEAKLGQGTINSFGHDIRSNISRHLLLSHDIWHVLFRYDTKPLGEAMIQTVTARAFNLLPAHLVGFFGAWKMARKTKSNLPWKVWKECLQITKNIDPSFALYSPLEFLEEDIQKIRNRFNIKTAKVYAKYVKNLPEFSRMDTIHPNYVDEEWEISSV